MRDAKPPGAADRDRAAVGVNDGTRAEVDVRPLLDDGPVLGPLHDPEYFGRAALDPVCGTVVWPNGADFAPESLRALAGDAAVA